MLCVTSQGFICWLATLQLRSAAVHQSCRVTHDVTEHLCTCCVSLRRDLFAGGLRCCPCLLPDINVAMMHRTSYHQVQNLCACCISCHRDLFAGGPLRCAAVRPAHVSLAVSQIMLFNTFAPAVCCCTGSCLLAGYAAAQVCCCTARLAVAKP